ncbi:GNAT family N-acetyltransferase [Vibrio astriarenae]|uniref:GNAT family N-acetyltransferase n=1 Tax=Vibrio astriarenae TaxID=1481923 RepID=A0A7Z2T626_9VIBR|nr:GNAT family N-acetyltransferase [Vibrio astriarenae]QIA65069.1 GNAT family N-acetyltransferase [Vibrio astriarenae]
MDVIIETERLNLRQLCDEDWRLFHSLQSEPSVIALCFDKPSEFEIKKNFESRLPQWNIDSEHWLCLMIIDQKSQMKVGVTGFRLSEGVAEVGYLLLPEFHGQGYATESLEAVLGWGDQLGVISGFQAVVTQGNTASERVLQKCGFYLSKKVENAYEIGGKLFDDHVYVRAGNQTN